MGAVCVKSTAVKNVSNPRCVKPVSLCVLEAAAAGDLDKLKALFECGASVHCSNQAGRTALHLASAEGHLEIVRYLLDLGAKICVQDRWGNEPINDAILGGHEEIIQLLKDQGAELSNESRTDMKIHLFHFSALGNVAGVADLLRRGTCVNATDYLGKTALHIASEKGHAELVRFLLNNGGDRDSVDSQGETPLNLAMENEHFEVQNILREAGATPRCVKADTPTPKKRARRASFTVMEAFPMPIAKAMLDGRKIEPINKECVSLFYSDIVGFTTISSTIDASTVSRMLNNLFRKFDRLAYVHGVQKVDVIGDAYIAASNFTENQTDDHAARLARFAIDAMAAAKETPIDEEDPNSNLGMVEIRIGMHCGPVSGAVLGTNVVKYTLMGESVHTASKMESSSLPGRIQCSGAIADLIAQQANDIEVIRRDGPGVTVPGKPGPIPTYWVSAVRERTGRFHSCPDLTEFVRAASSGAGGAAHQVTPFDLDMGDWLNRLPSMGDSFTRITSSGRSGPAAAGVDSTKRLASGAGGGLGGFSSNGSFRRKLPMGSPLAGALGKGKDGPAALMGGAVGGSVAAPVVGYGVDSCGRKARMRRNSTACGPYNSNSPSLICRL